MTPETRSRHASRSSMLVLLVLAAVACGSETPDGGGKAGASSGGASAGSSPSAGEQGSSKGGSAGENGAGRGGGSASSAGAGTSSDLSSVCMNVCTRFNQACSVSSAASCPEQCNMLASSTPAPCLGLQSDYFDCLSAHDPNCVSGSWGGGYEAVCDGKGRGLCIRTKGADCIAGAAYDDTLCQSFAEGNYGYYCRPEISPKPGCQFSTRSTYEGLYCCQAKLSL